MTLDEIKLTIEQAIPNSKALIFDPMNDGQHLQAVVISSSFENMLLVKQHQMVKKPLTKALAGDVHALSLKTFTPEKWETEKSKYGMQSKYNKHFDKRSCSALAHDRENKEI